MSPPSETRPQGHKLVIIIPALNEEPTVAETIRRIPVDIPGVYCAEVLVVDDGSTDSTAEQARSVGAKVVHHSRRQGVGVAFKTGLSQALEMGADIIASIDADGQFDPTTLRQLVRPVVEGQADFATASRFIDPTLIPKMPRSKLWGNRMMSRLISRLAKQRFHDVSCGMRCYNRRAAMSLNTIGTFNYAQEVFLNLAYKRLKMAEVPIPVRGERQYGKSRIATNLFGYAWKTLWIIFRCYRDYRPMRFFGWLSLGMAVPAVALEVFLLAHYLATGSFSPHKWAGFTGAGLMVLSLLLLQVGLVGDMLNRHRIYLEELLYYIRKEQADHTDRARADEP